MNIEDEQAVFEKARALFSALKEGGAFCTEESEMPQIGDFDDLKEGLSSIVFTLATNVAKIALIQQSSLLAEATGNCDADISEFNDDEIFEKQLKRISKIGEAIDELIYDSMSMIATSTVSRKESKKQSAAIFVRAFTDIRSELLDFAKNLVRMHRAKSKARGNEH